MADLRKNAKINEDQQVEPFYLGELGLISQWVSYQKWVEYLKKKCSVSFGLRVQIISFRPLLSVDQERKAIEGLGGTRCM